MLIFQGVFVFKYIYIYIHILATLVVALCIQALIVLYLIGTALYALHPFRNPQQLNDR